MKLGKESNMQHGLKNISEYIKKLKVKDKDKAVPLEA